MARAIGAVLDALTSIAYVITKLLKPGSPPLLLPDLDVWGAGAMNAYLEGWKDADFTILNDTVSMIERYVNAFPDLIKSDAISYILGGRGEAISTLNEYKDALELPVEAINRITSAAGISNSAMTDYIQALFRANKVTNELAEAEDILSYELGGVAVIYGEIVDSLAEFAEVASRYTGVGSEAVMSYVDALRDVEDAQKASAEAQKQLNQVTAYYDTLLASLYAKQNKLSDDLEDSTRLRAIDKALRMVILTAEERERLELEKRGILLKREIRDTELAKKTAVEAASAKFDAAQESQKKAEENARAQKKYAAELIKSTQEQAKVQVEAYRELLEIMIKGMELEKQRREALEKEDKDKEKDDVWNFSIPEMPDNALDDLSVGLQEAIDALKNELAPKWEEFMKAITDPFASIEGKVDAFVLQMGELKTAIEPIFSYIRDHATPILVGFTAAWAIFKITVGAAALVAGIKTFVEALIGGKGLVAALGLTINPVTALAGSLALLGATLIIFGPDAWKNTKLIIASMSDLIKAIDEEFLDQLLLKMYVVVKESLRIGLEWITNLIKGFAEGEPFALESVDTMIKEILDTIMKYGPDFLKDGVILLTEFILGVKGKKEELDKAFSDPIDEALDTFVRSLPDFVTSGAKFISGISDGIRGKVGELSSTVRNAIINVLNDLGRYWNDFYNAGLNFVEGMIRGAWDKAYELYDRLREIVNNSLDIIREISWSHSPSKRFAMESRNWILGLVKGISDNSGLVTSAMSNVVSDMISIAAAPALARSFALSSSAAGNPGGTINNNQQYYQIDMNPTYQNVQSPSSIYYDVSAALASTRR
jgi:hypothetical protein